MFKRLAAIFYDSLCLFSLFFLATLILIFLTKGESIASNNIAYDLFLALINLFIFRLALGEWRSNARYAHLAYKIKNTGVESIELGKCLDSLLPVITFIHLFRSWLCVGLI